MLKKQRAIFKNKIQLARCEMCEFCENGEDIVTLAENHLELCKRVSDDKLWLYLEMDKVNRTITASIGSDTYVSATRKIEYCPLCGRKLSEEIEKQNLRDRIIEKIKKTEPDYINYRDFYTKYGRVIPGIGDKWHWFENLTDEAKREGLL